MRINFDTLRTCNRVHKIMKAFNSVPQIYKPTYTISSSYQTSDAFVRYKNDFSSNTKN